jgi:four helix bundle protein
MAERLVSFQDVEVWRKSHKLVLSVYEVTKSFPADEKFGLTSQMRRAAVSVPANIAEGFKRQGIKDKLKFYNIAEGSLEELKYYFILALDLDYLKENKALLLDAEQISRQMNGLIASTRRRL